MDILGFLFGNNVASTFIAQPASIEMDVLIDESHEWTSDVTTSEVEEGSPIADHIRLMPDKLTITGMVGNTNLQGSFLDAIVGQVVGLLDGSGKVDRMKTTFDLLRAMHEARVPVTIYTKWKTYENMALTGLNIPRNASIGKAIQFTMNFMEIRVVSTQSVDVPDGISKKKDAKAGKKTQNKGAAQKDAGKVQSKTVPTEKSTSVLEGIKRSAEKVLQ